MTTQGERLKHLIVNCLNTNQSAFASKVGVASTFINQIIHGKRGLSASVLDGLSSSYPDVNITWLLSGAGEIFLEKTSPTSGMVEEGGTRYEAAPAQEEPPPALVVTDVTPLLRLMEQMREEMRAREAEMKERVEWLERRVRELEAAAEKGVGVGL